MIVMMVREVMTQEPVTVKWSLKEGQTFYAKAVTDMDMSMGILGMNVDLKMKTTAVQRFKVAAVKDGSTTVEMTFLDMTMSAEGLGSSGSTLSRRGPGSIAGAHPIHLIAEALEELRLLDQQGDDLVVLAQALDGAFTGGTVAPHLVAET